MLNGNTLVLPSGLPGIQGTTLDLSDLTLAESRINEVSLTNSHKAPELLATFNHAYANGVKILGQLELGLVYARRHVEKTKSRILLDKIPDMLKSRGLSTAKSPMGSEDLRQAILDGDNDYSTAVEARDILECQTAFVKNKIKAIEMAYTSVKKILGDSSQHRFPLGHIHGTDHFPEQGIGESPTTTGFAKKNRY